MFAATYIYLQTILAHAAMHDINHEHMHIYSYYIEIST